MPNLNKKSALFLPATPEELQDLSWPCPDIILVTGDAYVDHPSFGVALIGRWLQSKDFRVAILAQPDWRSADDFRSLGKPRLFWGITSGSIDSRLNNYTSLGRKRDEDLYSPAGRIGLRPDKPLLVYSARAREAFKDVPIILGGLEASLKRLVHYDYIEDQFKRSVLIDAKADLLVFGMGERAILEIAQKLDAGKSIRELTNIPGTAFPVFKDTKIPDSAIELPSFEQQKQNPQLAMDAQLKYQSSIECSFIQHQQGAPSIVVCPSARPLDEKTLDEIYALPFTRQSHPKYEKIGKIPALEPVQFSITTHRGCFGGCSFCSLYFHQGKHITSRSIGSILDEADKLSKHKHFRGTISDLGGPTANMYGMNCKKSVSPDPCGRGSFVSPCGRSSCLFPSPCKFLDADYRQLLKLMNEILKWKTKSKTKINVFIASGIRHDLALLNNDYIDLLAAHFVGGHLKVAPEHICPNVLQLMGKTAFELFEEFENRFNAASRKAGKKQYLVPYFISSHPGSTEEDALKLMEFLLKRNWRLLQVQDFTPVPLTLSTAMFVSGKDAKGKKIHVAKGRGEKKLQLALLQYHFVSNQKLLKTWLASKGRNDLLAKLRFQKNKRNRFKH